MGDDDQSIYGWRGATLDNLKKLPVDYPHLKVIKLEQNYRSTSAILRAANNVIGPNPKLFPKTLFSELGEGEPVRVVDADNEEHEAERAVARIQSLRAASNPPPDWKSFAILYRANHQAKPFEKALRKANIPYKVSGGTSFFDRAEIKDLCAWFRLWINNDDDPAFLRAITTPKRGIGHTTLAALGAFATQHKQSMFGALFNGMLPAAIPKRAMDGLHEFGRYINYLEYSARRTVGAEDARAFLNDWLKEIGYEQHLYDNEDSEKVAAARWSNVMEFCDWMAQRAGGQIDDTAGAVVAKETKSLLEVSQTIALLSTISEREQEQDMVTLSTLHASKGLEWPHVVLVGVTEGMLPFKLDDDEGRQQKVSDDTLQRLQEERRLMYVGITRAQQAQEGPRNGVGPAQPLHRRNGPGQDHRPRRPARKAQGPARRICRQESLGRQHPAALKGAAHHGTHPYGTLAHPSPPPRRSPAARFVFDSNQRLSYKRQQPK